MGSKLGKSLINLKNILSGSNYIPPDPSPVTQFKPRPKDTPIVPRRPARRKSSFHSKSKTTNEEGSKENQFSLEDTIREVDTPVESPTFPREPKVAMPGIFFKQNMGWKSEVEKVVNPINLVDRKYS